MATKKPPPPSWDLVEGDETLSNGDVLIIAKLEFYDTKPCWYMRHVYVEIDERFDNSLTLRDYVDHEFVTDFSWDELDYYIKLGTTEQIFD
jgi:hypothetical protein